MNMEQARQLLADHIKAGGFTPLDRLERDGGWIPMEAALAAIMAAASYPHCDEVF